MWNPNNGGDQTGGKEERVIVAIDKDKTSQYALKWAVDHVVGRSKIVTLLHVRQKTSSTIPTPTGNLVSLKEVNEDVARAVKQQLDLQAKELFLPFRCFCSRKDIKCNEVVVEDTDIPKAIIDYITDNAFEVVVLGASTRNGLINRRFKGPDVSTTVSKNAPEFCTVYVISKGKIMTVRSATRSVPTVKPLSPSPLPPQQQRTESPRNYNIPPTNPPPVNQIPHHPNNLPVAPDHQYGYNNIYNNSPRSTLPKEMEFRSPFTRGKAANGRSYGDISLPPEADISVVGGGGGGFVPGIDQYGGSGRMFEAPINYDGMDNYIRQIPKLSNELDRLSVGSDRRYVDYNSFSEQYSPSASSSHCSGFSSTSSMNTDEVESEMRRLKLELKQTMEMYNAACKEALTAKQKAKELHTKKMEERQRLEEARIAEETALALAEKEKAKCRTALEAAEAAQKIAELESQKRMSAEMKAIKEAEDKKKALQTLTTPQNVVDTRYRKYTIEEIEIATDYFSTSLKIGEGGYGPVYKSTLDHTPVAIKVLRPDAAQGQTQFQQEVEILSCIRHPNMVLLLGACPEYGCLVYEHMSNGSLEDRLFCKGNTPTLPWQLRFRIAAEIATGLLFLHQTKPEPLVHRDLKPGNILLDRNFTSKISDVGLARLVPPSVADTVTQYRMTQTAGTFCYIDPEYQQTGMLGIKSDVYSLGIILLQLVTGKEPMGLTHHIERAMEKGNVVEMFDPRVDDWPEEETIKLIKIALSCAELRRKDRPDLGTVVLPELNKLKEFAENRMIGAAGAIGFGQFGAPGKLGASATQHGLIHPDVITDPHLGRSGGYDSRSNSTFLSSGGL